MSNNNTTDKNNKTYWPHMILGFLAIGITLGYWTIKSANALPVQESNDYMLKYQEADIHMNDILERKKAFDKAYTIRIEDTTTMVMIDNINSNRPQPNPITLSLGANQFSYSVVSKEGKVIKDAKVSFVLTRPHTRKDDVPVSQIAFTKQRYVTPVIDIQKEGRYTLQFRAIIGNTIGYSELAAYLKL
ncbi:MAG: hypothetical protein Q9M36_13935 [Sulfurovum sp.]|nr:hypothetical protein [Sulfurovum sp.]